MEFLQGQLGLFADDAKFWRTEFVFFIDEIKNDLQKDVLKLRKLAESWGVTISQAKSVSIMFVKLSRATNPFLIFNHKLIPEVSKVRFLGVIFYQSLNLKAHITNVVDNCHKSSMFIMYIM